MITAVVVGLMLCNDPTSNLCNSVDSRIVYENYSAYPEWRPDPPYPERPHLTESGGTFEGPSGHETYYNLPMGYCIELMRNMGYTVEEYPFWVREDGAKMLGNYVMCAADLSIRPKGTILETSLGQAIVVDTGTFRYSNQTQLDMCVDW